MLAAVTLMLTTADRVSDARAAKGEVVRQLIGARRLSYPPNRLYMRAFKSEGELEIWAAGAKGKYKLVKVYPIAAHSGAPGPKRKEGDLQVPEGFYTIDRYNPESRFLLSLRVSYPNASDRVLSDPERPGFDIYIHGNRVSVGCLAMTDDLIQEIYLLALDVKRKPIPIHIFPAKMKGPAWTRMQAAHPEHSDFWASLRPAYESFNRSKTVPRVRILKSGLYRASG